MKQVEQSVTGAPEGDCFAACLASILELPLSEVPNVNIDPRVTKGSKNWMDIINEFLGEYMLWAAMMNVDRQEWVSHIPPNAYWIAGGYGVRPDGTIKDLLHAVVYQGPNMVWDPNVEGRGIEKVLDATVLVPYNANDCMPVEWVAGFEEPNSQLEKKANGTDKSN